ncbi:MAG TPA: methionine--tRNA ligase [Phycisphaerales bacterium]|nr:methionine--tRNA ligase [Phycisphaerales bacterium]
MNERKAIYVTTPIYYVNDRPHIGHVYTTTVCDAYARFMRMCGEDVFFLTGTDEHGQKVEKSAAAKGVTPQQLADENSAEFEKTLRKFGLSNDDFIRTTDPEHMKQVQAYVRTLKSSGAVYLGEFEGWYDEGQEEYYTETKAKDLGYKSPVSARPLVKAKEKNYYFKLSAFQGKLEELFKARPDFVRPEARRNEVLGRLKEGLQDVPVSRTNFRWGVEMPDDPEHVIYVWIDALFNYITALGLVKGSGCAGKNGKGAGDSRRKYWPAKYHVMGKEILWFHAVIWPALLMALELDLPECVYAHSFWIRDGQKMSKSLGNFLDLEAITGFLDRYGLDAWRYYMVTQGPLGAQDANFSDTHFHEVYTTDLVNTVGNCASRVTAMIGKYFDGVVPGDAGAGPRNDWNAIATEHVKRAKEAYEELELSHAVSEGLALLRKVDAYINETEPFKVAKAAATDAGAKAKLASILYQCVECVRVASLILGPVMPEKMMALWKALNVGDVSGTNAGAVNAREAKGVLELAKWGGMKAGTKVEKVALFPRVEVVKAEQASVT